ncbi:MAG: 23S rRNA (pseudouridine(1915)-N(3))-methyltransferase RlmH [Alphaproteobacteria bacterium]|nr:23S rRNA (pseudouridine(1915)-N(3))-methyltransferase RlmH [Alphaproteobacteria bacterium]
MRVLIAAVGKDRGSPTEELCQTYFKRLPWPVELKEVELKGNRAASAMRVEEGKALLKAIPEGAYVIALDGRGEPLSSEALAVRLKRLQDEGTKAVAFVIGGAEGLDPEILKAARLRLSLGAMTWPHLLARAMLAEQLYRAASIIAGHPYHRG